MTYQYRLTTSAVRELERELDYSAKKWGKRHAKFYRQSIYRS